MYMYVTYIIHDMGAQPTRVLLLRNQEHSLVGGGGRYVRNDSVDIYDKFLRLMY